MSAASSEHSEHLIAPSEAATSIPPPPSQLNSKSQTPLSVLTPPPPSPFPLRDYGPFEGEALPKPPPAQRALPALPRASIAQTATHMSQFATTRGRRPCYQQEPLSRFADEPAWHHLLPAGCPVTINFPAGVSCDSAGHVQQNRCTAPGPELELKLATPHRIPSSACPGSPGNM